MIKLIAVCLLQSALSVSGSILLSLVLKSGGTTTLQIFQAGYSVRGLSGIAFMLASFGVLTYALAEYKPSTFIPVNTATTFIVTVILSYVLGNDRVSVAAVLGMVLIASGIALVVRGQ